MHPARRALAVQLGRRDGDHPLARICYPQKAHHRMMGFSKGHWENAEAAHGDTRNAKDLARWRGLAKVGFQTDRKLISEQAGDCGGRPRTWKFGTD